MRRAVVSLVMLLFFSSAVMAGQNWKGNEIGRLKNRASNGDPVSQLLLGLSYAQGKGVAKSETEAVKWFKKAAYNNLPDAQYCLARSYQTGLGIKKSQKKANKWFLKAARNGHAKSMFNIGFGYAEGDGIKKDLVLAYKWLSLSEILLPDSREKKFAKQMIYSIKDDMTHDQIKFSQKLIEKQIIEFRNTFE